MNGRRDRYPMTSSHAPSISARQVASSPRSAKVDPRDAQSRSPPAALPRARLSCAGGLMPACIRFPAGVTSAYRRWPTLSAGWPRWWTGFDLVVNVLVCVPLGYLLTLALSRRTGRWLPALLGALLAATLSFCMETAQTWLPTRVASNLDSPATPPAASSPLPHGPAAPHALVWLARTERRLVAPLPHADLGLILLGLWLVTQLSPETLLFGAGDFASCWICHRRSRMRRRAPLSSTCW